MRMPFVIYGDFECFTEQLPTCTSCRPSNEKSFTHKYRLHTPSGYGLYTHVMSRAFIPRKTYYTVGSRIAFKEGQLYSGGLSRLFYERR